MRIDIDQYPFEMTLESSDEDTHPFTIECVDACHSHFDEGEVKELVKNLQKLLKAHKERKVEF